MAVPNGLSYEEGGYKTKDHYGELADNYDYLYKGRHESQFAALLKYFDIQSDHKIVDIASGTSDLAERLQKTFQLKSNVWCVEPSAEMQQVAKKKKGVYAVEKTAEEFLSELNEGQLFDRAICIGAAHHFTEPVKTYKGIEASLSPGGVFWVVQVGEYIYPWFTKSGINVKAFVGERKKGTASLLRAANFDVEVSEEKIDYYVKKSQWYEMLRDRFHSSLRQLSDEEIEEGISELENGKLKDLKLSDDVCMTCMLLIFTAKKKN